MADLADLADLAAMAARFLQPCLGLDGQKGSRHRGKGVGLTAGRHQEVPHVFGGGCSGYRKPLTNKSTENKIQLKCLDICCTMRQ